MAHDIETRRRAIAYWAEGHTKAEAAAKFGVSESALHAWRTQLNEIGTLVPKTQRTEWRKIDQVKLVKYVKEYPDALKRNTHGYSCTKTKRSSFPQTPPPHFFLLPRRKPLNRGSIFGII